MLKVFLLATFATLSLAASTGGSSQYLPYNPLWGQGFGNAAAAANMQNVMDESDGQGIALPPGGLKPGQFVSFQGDFPQVYGPGTNPVFQTGEMDVPAQFINGQLVPVPKPDHDGNIDTSPQFFQQQGYPSILNPITTAQGLIPAAPTVPGQSQQYPYFASDNLGELYQFQGYGCLGGECDLEDIMQANALANLFNPKAPTAAGTTTGTTATAPAAPATAPAAPATAPAAPAPAAPTAQTLPNTAGQVPAPAATAASNFGNLIMMMNGNNPLGDEDTQRTRVATDFLNTLPGGNLIARYGNINDSPYGESDAFIMTPNGPQVNLDNFDRRLQKTHVAEATTQKKTSVTEDPFFWCFLATLVILISGISVLVVRKRRATTLENVLMETNYTSHV